MAVPCVALRGVGNEGTWRESVCFSGLQSCTEVETLSLAWNGARSGMPERTLGGPEDHERTESPMFLVCLFGFFSY